MKPKAKPNTKPKAKAEYKDYEVLRNVGGHPPFYRTPEEMAEKAIEYFEHCAKTGERRKVTGLVLYLGFQDKKSLRDYREKPEFSPLIKKMLTLVEKHYEDRLDENNPAGAIFALKNMGWDDKVETVMSGGLYDVKVDLSEYEKIKNELKIK